MVYGIGVDMQSVSAFEVLQEEDVFFSKTFTLAERTTAAKCRHSHQYYAKRFAAKEAVIKAFHTDTNRIRLSEVETLNDEMGVPFVKLYGNLFVLAEQKGVKTIHISLSFDCGFAVAYALLWAET